MWPDSDETKELISRARSGDQAAASDLLERHREALRRLVGMRLDRAIQNRVDSSDVRARRADRGPPQVARLFAGSRAAVSSLAAADRSRPTNRRSSPASGYRPPERGSGTIAPDSIVCRSVRHGSGRALAGPAQLTPAAALLRQELALRFRAAIERLDEPDREIIEMRHGEQLSNQEVAQALGLSEPAAGMRYLRTVRRLRALLEEVPSTAGG